MTTRDDLLAQLPWRMTVAGAIASMTGRYGRSVYTDDEADIIFRRKPGETKANRDVRQGKKDL